MKIISRPVAALVSALVLFAGAASAQEECPMPRAGTWRLDTTQTMTMAGPGGPGGSAPFTLRVDACGLTMTLDGFGSAESGASKTFYPTGPNSYQYVTVVQRMPLQIDMTFTDPEHMTGQWVLAAGFAISPATATFLNDLGSGYGNDPRCDCPAFTDQLLARLEANDALIERYSDPAYSLRPETLDPSVEWSAGLFRRFEELSLDSGGSLWPEEAKAEVGREVARGALLDLPDTAYDPETGALGYIAELNCEDCRPAELPPLAGCAGDVLTEARAARVQSYRTSCDAVVEEASLKPLGLLNPPYCGFTRVPMNLVNETRAAYQAENDTIRSRYLELCGRPLD